MDKKKDGLAVLKEHHAALIEKAVAMGAPYLTKDEVEDIVMCAYTRGVDPENVLAVEVAARIMGTSRSTLYRKKDRQKDWYSILEKITSVLAPKYPEWMTSFEILGQLVSSDPTLSLKHLEAILGHYVKRRCFERAGDRYRLAPFVVWVQKELPKREKRVREHLETMLVAVEGFVRGEPRCEFGVIDMWVTEEEYEAFVLELKAATEVICLKHSSPDYNREGKRHFTLFIVAGQAKGIPKALIKLPASGLGQVPNSDGELRFADAPIDAPAIDETT